jgi:hypothetical protein
MSIAQVFEFHDTQPGWAIRFQIRPLVPSAISEMKNFAAKLGA